MIYKQKSMQAYRRNVFDSDQSLSVDIFSPCDQTFSRENMDSKQDQSVFILSRGRGSIDLNLWVEPAFENEQKT